MQRLTGLDAAFLSLEVPTAPMHVASLIVLDPSTIEGGLTVARLRDHYESRLHLAPPFRRRLVEVPFGIHHPLWIEDPDFNLNFHIRHIAVPAPGTMDELSDLVGHLVAMPLDRRRPLWEVWLIDGLEDGNVALLSKVHHAAIDGASGEELMVAILDLSPEGENKPPTEPWRPDRMPTDTELVTYAAWSLAQNPIKLYKATRRTLDAAFQVRRYNRRRGTAPPPSPFRAPRTSLNQHLTPHRRLAMASLSLPAVKRVKNTFGVTVNDVILSLCGTALRRYLASQDEHPDRALVAMVPVSIRTEDKKGAMGNEVSSVLTTLATDVDDPVERLLAVSGGMKLAKEQFKLIGADTLQNWTEFAAPAVLGRAARIYSRVHAADIHRPAFNVTMSNVPGPPFPLYITGAQVKAVYPVGPIYDGPALNITVMSYLDSLDFGINVCPDIVPESWRITEALHDALAELLTAADAHDGPAAEAVPAPPPAAEPVATAPEPTPVPTARVADSGAAVATNGVSGNGHGPAASGSAAPAPSPAERGPTEAPVEPATAEAAPAASPRRRRPAAGKSATAKKPAKAAAKRSPRSGAKRTAPKAKALSEPDAVSPPTGGADAAPAPATAGTPDPATAPATATGSTDGDGPAKTATPAAAPARKATAKRSRASSGRARTGTGETAAKRSGTRTSRPSGTTNGAGRTRAKAAADAGPDQK
jgi:diacylglycerol O-acyltransferase